MKRIFAVVLTVILVVGVIPLPVFADGLNSGVDSAYGSLLRKQAVVDYIKDAGLYLSDDVSPEKFVTRGEVAYVIGRSIGVADTGVESGYLDVDSSHPNSSYINALGENGIMRGADGFFRPDDYMTREEFAVIVDRTYSAYFGGFSEVFDFYPELFVDSADVSEWAKESVARAVESGLFLAKKGRIFDAKANVDLFSLAWFAKAIYCNDTFDGLSYSANTDINPDADFDVLQSAYILSTGTAGFEMLARFDGAPGRIYVSRTTSSDRNNMVVSGDRWTYDPVPIARVQDPTGKVVARVGLYDIEDGKMSKIIDVPSGDPGIWIISIVGGRTGDLVEIGINGSKSWGIRGGPYFETTKETFEKMYFWVPNKIGSSVCIGSRQNFTINDVNNKVVSGTSSDNRTYVKYKATITTLKPGNVYYINRTKGIQQSVCIAGMPKLLCPTAEMAEDLKGGIVYASDGTQCHGPLQARARDALLKLYSERSGDFSWVDNHPEEIPKNLISPYAESESIAKIARIGNTKFGYYDPVTVKSDADIPDETPHKNVFYTDFERYDYTLDKYNYTDDYNVGWVYLENSQVNYGYGESAFLDSEMLRMLHLISASEDILVMGEEDHRNNLGHHYYNTYYNFNLERVLSIYYNMSTAFDGEYLNVIREGIQAISDRQIQVRGNNPTNQLLHGVISAMYMYLVTGMDHYHEAFKRGVRFALSYNIDIGWDSVGQAPAGYFIEQYGPDGNYEHMNAAFFGHIYEEYCLSDMADAETVDFINDGIDRGLTFQLMFKGYEKEGYNKALTTSHASRTNTSIQDWGGQPGYSELRAYLPKARRLDENEEGYKGEQNEVAYIYPHLMRSSWSEDVINALYPKYEDNFNGTHRTASIYAYLGFRRLERMEKKYRNLMNAVEPAKAPVDYEKGIWTDVPGVASIGNNGVYLVTFYNSTMKEGGQIADTSNFGGPAAVSTVSTAGLVSSMRQTSVTSPSAVKASCIFGTNSNGNFWVSGKEVLTLEVVEEGKSFKTVGKINGSSKQIEWLYEITDDGVAVIPTVKDMVASDDFWYNIPLTTHKNTENVVETVVEDGKMTLIGNFRGEESRSYIEWEKGFEYEYNEAENFIRIKINSNKPLKVEFKAG